MNDTTNQAAAVNDLEAALEVQAAGAGQALTSWVRTVTPGMVAAGATVLAERTAVEISPETTAAAVVVVLGIYHAVIRRLEKVDRRFGWLLGSPNAPVYMTKGA